MPRQHCTNFSDIANKKPWPTMNKKRQDCTNKDKKLSGVINKSGVNYKKNLFNKFVNVFLDERSYIIW